MKHECVFVEEQEPSGRLILGPCLTCGLAAMDALSELRTEVKQRRLLMAIVAVAIILGAAGFSVVSAVLAIAVIVVANVAAIYSDRKDAQR